MVQKVSIYVRPQSLVKAKENFLEPCSDQTDCYLEFHDLTDADHFQKELRQTDLLVNATSVGMDGESLPISIDTRFPKELFSCGYHLPAF